MINGNREFSVYTAFTTMASQFGDRPFLRAPASATQDYSPVAIEYSYASAQAAVESLRAGYQNFEVKEGDRVALAFDSRLDVYLHLLALNSLGASIVPLNMASSDNELCFVIEHSDSRLITGADEHQPRLLSIVADLQGISSIQQDKLRSPARPLSEKPQGELETEAALLYTSGTTGKPKGCMLSNAYFLTMGREYNALGGLCTIDDRDRLATPLPPNHMNALATSFMAMLMCGGCVIQLDRFHPRSWWKTVREEGATVIHYLGVMPAILLTLPERSDEDFSNQVKFGFGAGSDPRHQEIFENRFGFPLIEAWAMTESGGGGMTVANVEPRHLGQRCIGRPIDSMEYRIVDESDSDVQFGHDGELLVRSRGENPRQGFFSRYYKDEAATEKGWKGGWWHTGDVIREGPDGSLFFVDRRKNVIRRSGENIAAVEVEASVLQHKSVVNCAVCAVPDELRGDEVFAFVVAAGDIQKHRHLAQEIFEYSMQKLTYFKAPAYISFIEELPLTASQKISRAEVKILARERLLSGQAFDLRAEKRRPVA